MRGRPGFYIFLVTVLAGGAAPPARGAETPQAVIALIDTGINPYHVAFRDPSPGALQHPSTYLPGYPADAIALPITLDEPSWRRAVRRDCATVWATVERGKLYWFPGTKIVGAITFQHPSVACPADIFGAILDDAGHGTMTASRATSVEYGACRECRVVSVQGLGTESLTWAAESSEWIDAQSNSWSPTVPLWEPAGVAFPFVATPAFVRTVEAAAGKHLFFWSSGNGAAGRLGVLGHPTPINPKMTPSVVMVGGHDSGYVTLWHGFPPHVVSDSCNSWAAYHNSTTASADNVGGGTSGAAPFAAGGAVRILLEARAILGDARTGVRDGIVASGPEGLVPSGPLANGELTVAEWRELVQKTATPRPARQFEDGSVCDVVAGLVLFTSTPVRWVDVPPEYPEFVNIGYGAVDDPSKALALKVLRGEAPLPDRSRTDQYFAIEGPVREQMHEVYSRP